MLSEAAGSCAIRKKDLRSVWNFFLSGSRPTSRSFHIVPLPLLFLGHFILLLSLLYFHATSHCSSLSRSPLFPRHFTLFLSLSPSFISTPLHIVSLPSLFLGHFTFPSLYFQSTAHYSPLYLLYFHATSHCPPSLSISNPLHIIPLSLSSISTPLHIVPLSFLYFHGTSHCPPSLSLYFQSTAHYSPLSPSAATQNVFRHRNAAPVLSCAALHKMFILFLYLYFLTSLSPRQRPAVHRKHEDSTFLTVQKSSLVVSVVPHDVRKRTLGLHLGCCTLLKDSDPTRRHRLHPNHDCTHKFWFTASVLWTVEGFGSGPVECGFQIRLVFSGWKDNWLNPALPHKSPDFARTF